MNPLDMIGVGLKAKYIKRTGSPGKYTYTYREGGKKPSKGKTTYSGKYPGGYNGIGLNEANKRMERVKGTKFSKGMSAVINGQLQSVKELGFEEFKKRVNSAINKDYPVVLDINGEKTGI